MNKEPVTVSVTPKITLPELPKIPEIPDAPEIQDIEFINFTAEEIKSKSSDELKAILSGELYPDKALSRPIQLLIDAELRERSFNTSRKPYWTIWLGLIVGIGSMVIAYLGYSEGKQSSAPIQQSADKYPSDPAGSENSNQKKQDSPTEPKNKPRKHALQMGI